MRSLFEKAARSHSRERRTYSFTVLSFRAFFFVVGGHVKPLGSRFELRCAKQLTSSIFVKREVQSHSCEW